MKIAHKLCFCALVGLSGLYALPVSAQLLAQDAAVASLAGTAAAEAHALGKEVNTQAEKLVDAQAQGAALSAQQGTVLPSGTGSSEMPKAVSAGTQNADPLSGFSPSVQPSPVIQPPSFDAGKSKDEKGDMKVPKVPESVNSVVKRLNTATENVTLEDLNSAREAIAKLDVLIEIEQRLDNLSKIREEREGKSLEAAIPASALGGGRNFPTSNLPMPQAQPTPAPIVMMPPVSSSVDVVRILGSAGRYVALIKDSEGKPAQYREGDKAPDGSLIQKITSRGVTLIKNKSEKTIQVKDVGTVFGGS